MSINFFYSYFFLKYHYHVVKLTIINGTPIMVQLNDLRIHLIWIDILPITESKRVNEKMIKDCKF